jgi:hypothetical protein
MIGTNHGGNDTGDGRLPAAPGSRPSGRAAAGVSPVPASIPSAALSAFSFHWEGLGAVASRLGLKHGNSVAREARALRDAGWLESRRIGTSRNVRWRRVAHAAPGLRDAVAKHKTHTSRWAVRVTGNHSGPNEIAIGGFITTAKDLRECIAKIEELAAVLQTPDQYDALATDDALLEENLAASAIEARRAETQGGSVEDESAGPKDDAQEVHS